MTRTLVICEKPTSAGRLAEALDEHQSPNALREQGVPYFQSYRDGKEYVVVPALGHLFTLTQASGTWNYPVFDIRWVPAHTVDKTSRTENFVAVISRLSKDVDGYISACDYDVEGSLIAYMILRHLCGEASLGRSRRMTFSTLTRKDLEHAFASMMPTLDFPMIFAGKARHEVDFLFGINLSRALILSLRRATGRYKTLSIGRVQGPALSFIKDREVEIRTFVPTPFWTVEAEAIIEGKRYPLEYSQDRIARRSELDELLRKCQGSQGVVKEIASRSTSQPPPSPFSIGDLQREAYSLFRYAPATTLSVAEQLYLNALISYPRTSSQRIPPSIDIGGVLKGLSLREEYRSLVAKLLATRDLKPRQGEKDDPAHPAIHPTGALPEKSLTPLQSNIYDIVVRRFMASLAEPSRLRTMRVDVDVNGNTFYLRGREIEHYGWMEFYEPYVRKDEAFLPPLSLGQKIEMIGLGGLQKYTSPPPRLNPSTMLRYMEEVEIGTKATRADIIDTLFRRGYVDGQTMSLTDLGLSIAETMETYCPSIASVEMTRTLEREMELIQLGEREPDRVIAETVGHLKPILEQFKTHEKAIGTELYKAISLAETKASDLGPCPTCQTGMIRIIRSRTSGKRFAGCSNFSTQGCKRTYPLPQSGQITPLGKSCESCGAPMIRLTLRGRPFSSCIDPDCPAKRRPQE